MMKPGYVMDQSMLGKINLQHFFMDKRYTAGPCEESGGSRRMKGGSQYPSKITHHDAHWVVREKKRPQ